MRMGSFCGLAAALVSLIALAPSVALAQNPYGPGVRIAQNPAGVPAGPAANGPVMPNGPRPAAGPPQPGVNRPLAAAPAAPPPPMEPDWVKTLTPAHLKAIDDILKFWEFKSAQITHFDCQFERWEYSPEWGPKDPNIAYTYATGLIKFEKPDKGLFKVESLGFYAAPKAAGAKASYDPRPGELGEHWVCDGVSIFEHLPNQQILRETKLPKEMQGKAIANGPLPFMFGMEAEKLKQRYWMRIITPKESQNQYWLEAAPKFRGDAGNYRRVEVILSATDFLPDAMQLYLPNGRGRVVFQFANRHVNPVLNNLIPFWKSNDFRPTLPTGWRREVNDASRPAPQPTPLTSRPGVPRS